MYILNSRHLTRGAAASFALALTLLTGHAQAADYKVGSLQITQPWARATPKGASTGAAYMTVTNTGTAAAKLSCASSDAAAQCQIHEMSMDNGVMKMRPVEDGLEIKPGETVTLKPTSLHVMFMDIKHPLEQGKTVEATLRFEKAGTVKVEFQVAAIGASGSGAPADGGMMQMDKH
jgi:copper(I)-binding protein